MQLGAEEPENGRCPEAASSGSNMGGNYYSLAAFGLSPQVCPYLNWEMGRRWKDQMKAITSSPTFSRGFFGRSNGCPRSPLMI